MTTREPDSLLEEEGAGYLISVSDLMAGLLFIFIITLMAFVLSYQHAQRLLEAEQQRTERQRDELRAVVDELTNTRRVRDELLQDVQRRLVARGLAVEVDYEHGILHLPERVIHFGTARADLEPEEERKLRDVARVLGEVLPCYVSNPKPPPECEERVQGKLESVLIEGHTDNRRYLGTRFKDNWDLSAQRAMYTFRTMIAAVPLLAQLRNAESFPILGIAGYGDGRPRNYHAVPTDDPANRRIDLRFIMAPPRATPEVVRKVGERLR